MWRSAICARFDVHKLSVVLQAEAGMKKCLSACLCSLNCSNWKTLICFRNWIMIKKQGSNFHCPDCEPIVSGTCDPNVAGFRKEFRRIHGDNRGMQSRIKTGHGFADQLTPLVRQHHTQTRAHEDSLLSRAEFSRSIITSVVSCDANPSTHLVDASVSVSVI